MGVAAPFDDFILIFTIFRYIIELIFEKGWTAMQFLNRDFYNNNNILGYIDSSMQALINMNTTILTTKEYMLFFYIKEDFTANYFSLYTTDIDLECLGFSVLQRNTRHSIEAFLDLVNLSNDQDYLSVMEFNSKKEDTIQSIALTLMESFSLLTKNIKLQLKCIMKIFLENY